MSDDDKGPYSDDEVNAILDAREARDARVRQLHKASLERQDAELRAQRAERQARLGPFWWRPTTWLVIGAVILISAWIASRM